MVFTGALSWNTDNGTDFLRLGSKFFETQRTIGKHFEEQGKLSGDTSMRRLPLVYFLRTLQGVAPSISKE